MDTEAIGKIRWSPLAIIALFLALAESAMVYAAVNTTNTVQLIFTWFAVIFPFGVVTAFFITLFYRNWVFYPPWEFKKSSAKEYKDAMTEMQSKAGTIHLTIDPVPDPFHDLPDLPSAIPAQKQLPVAGDSNV